MEVVWITEGDGHRKSAGINEVSRWYDELSQKDQSIMLAVVEHLVEHGRPPTRREIAELTGISSTSVISAHLKSLQEAGYVLITPGITRGIGLVDRGVRDIEI